MSLTTERNKLELFHWQIKTGWSNICKEVHLGRLLALFGSIKLSWKNLPGTNTPTYFIPTDTDKSFISLTPRPNVIKLSLSVIYGFS